MVSKRNKKGIDKALVLGFVLLMGGLMALAVFFLVPTQQTAFTLNDAQLAAKWAAETCPGYGLLSDDRVAFSCTGGTSSADCVENGGVTHRLTWKDGRGLSPVECGIGFGDTERPLERKTESLPVTSHTIIDGVETDVLSAGSHLTVQCTGNMGAFSDIYQHCNPYYVYSRVNARALPCVADANQIIVFEGFAGGDSISKADLNIEAVKLCSGLPPVIADSSRKIYYQDCLTANPDLCQNILAKVNNEQTYIVPGDLAVGMWYISEKPSYVTAVCEEGGAYLVKEGYCADLSGILSVCTRGIIQPDGSCLLQPEIGVTGCEEGRIVEDETGQLVCEVVLPVRESFECGDGRVVGNQEECAVVVEQKLLCGGEVVGSVDDCVTVVGEVDVVNCPIGSVLKEVDGERVCEEIPFKKATKTASFLWVIPVFSIILGLFLVLARTVNSFGKKSIS